MPKIDRRTLSVFGLAAMLPPQFALAEDAYPSRPIHVIVGFTPGAAADITARVLGESMGPILGRQIVVENKPGAGSSIVQGWLHAVPCDVVHHRQPDHQSQSVSRFG